MPSKIAKVLSEMARKHIKEKNFAIPDKEKYPIHDLAHARNALARVSQFGTPEEKAQVRAKVYRRYPQLKKEFEERHGVSPLNKKVLRAKETGNVSKTAQLLASQARAALNVMGDLPEEMKEAGLTVASQEMEEAIKLGQLIEQLMEEAQRQQQK